MKNEGNEEDTISRVLWFRCQKPVEDSNMDAGPFWVAFVPTSRPSAFSHSFFLMTKAYLSVIVLTFCWSAMRRPLLGKWPRPTDNGEWATGNGQWTVAILANRRRMSARPTLGGHRPAWFMSAFNWVLSYSFAKIEEIPQKITNYSLLTIVLSFAEWNKMILLERGGGERREGEMRGVPCTLHFIHWPVLAELLYHSFRSLHCRIFRHKKHCCWAP